MWLLFQLELIVTLSLSQPVVLGDAPVTLPLVARDDRVHGRRIYDAAKSPDETVVLVLKNVTVDAPPGVSWEVHVEPVGGEGDPRDPHLVGLISAYVPEDKPAQFDLVLDEAIKSAGRRDLQLRFVPVSGVEVDGQPQPAEFRSSMSIGEISLAIESAAGD
jgi:hypothetical protein